MLKKSRIKNVVDKIIDDKIALISDQALILQKYHLPIRKKPKPQLTLHKKIQTLPILSIANPKNTADIKKIIEKRRPTKTRCF